MDYIDDDDAFEGPDAYVDDEYDIEDQVAEDDDHDMTGEADDDGLNRQRQSIMDMLNNTFVSVLPGSQTIEPTGRSSAILSSSLTIDQVRLLLAAARSHGLRTNIRVTDSDNYQEDQDPDYVPPDDGDDDDDDDDYSPVYNTSPFGPRPYASKAWFKPVTEPQENGVRLIHSGEFGRLNAKKPRNIRRMLRERESRVTRHGQGVHKEDFARALVPNTNGTVVASYGSNAYSGQYSADSSFYYTCCQDWRLHVYDTQAPLSSISREERQRRRLADDEEHETTMKTMKTVQAVPGSWTITDSHLSPDNERLIYSSITSTVYMTKTFEPSAPQVPLRFGSSGGGRRRTWDSDADDFGIYSCRFSADGNEVIAGGNGSNGGELRVYDLLAERKTVTIDAHKNDVNSCCWADTSSGNVLISASDDTFVKVWDRRSLGSTQKPSGVLVGHTEGITYVSAKGDGRYIISNGKDQAIRLWDLRHMHSNADFEKIGNKYYGHRGFDYRYGSYPRPTHKAHPRDCSVMTYRGHQVFKTLIRCHFSPIETTGANYIYTGSSDGRIHIYSLDGRVVQILDRGTTLPIYFDPSDYVLPEKTNRTPVCVRDVSWHSQEPVLMSVGWDSGYGRSSVARHEWKGIGKFDGGVGKLEDYVEKTRLERPYQTRSATRLSRMPGSFDAENED